MIKVLIVDDEPLARENLRVFLQEQNKTEKMRFQVRVHNLFLPMQKVMKYH